MPRSISKGPFIDKAFLLKVTNNVFKNKISLRLKNLKKSILNHKLSSRSVQLDRPIVQSIAQDRVAGLESDKAQKQTHFAPLNRAELHSIQRTLQKYMSSTRLSLNKVARVGAALRAAQEVRNPRRSRRALWGEAKRVKHKQKFVTRINSRNSYILPSFIDQTFLIHNGKKFIKLKVNEEMIGYKFGEFASTRKKHTISRNPVRGKNKR